MQPNLHIRVLFNEFRNNWRDIFVAKRHRAGQRYRATRGVFLIGDGVFGFLHFGQNAQAVAIINIALGRQANPARGAVQKPNAQSFFKARNAV